MNLWEDLEKNDYENKLEDNKIEKVLLKMILTDNMTKTIRKSITKLIDTENYRYAYFNSQEGLSKKLRKQYTNFFDAILPECENDLETDLFAPQSIRNNIDLIYGVKGIMLNKILSQIMYNSKITNWGYIPEDSSEKDKRKVLIGIDYPGFNMPLKLHMNKDELIEYLEMIKGNAVLPVYEGNGDMTYKGKKLTTKIFMPLTEKRESEIIKANKEINSVDSKYLYVRHIGNLITKKCKKILKIYPQKYIDLKTKNMGTKRNGKFIPDAENENTNLKQEDIDKGKNLG